MTGESVGRSLRNSNLLALQISILFFVTVFSTTTVHSAASCSANPIDKQDATGSGFSSQPTDSFRISAFGRCRTITNTSNNSFFIPVRSSAEWMAFNSNLPLGISLASCNSPDWSITNWSACSNTCGNGTQSRIISCLMYDCEQNTGNFVDTSECSSLPDPGASTQACYSDSGCTSCSAQTVNNCNLNGAAHNSTSGSCASGYAGSCNYQCNNGSWSLLANSCVSPVPSLNRILLSIRGGIGGSVATDRFCPSGTAITALNIRSGSEVDNISAGCQSINPTTKVASGGVSFLSGIGGFGGSLHSVSCPAGQVAIGINGREGDRTDRVSLICGNFDGSSVSVTASYGGWGGIPYSEQCPGGFALVGFQEIRTGSLIDRFRPVCGVVYGPDISVSPVYLSARGGIDGTSQPDSVCGTNQAVTSLSLRTGSEVDRVSIGCQNIDLGTRTPTGVISYGTHFGGSGGTPSTLSCPANKIAVGLSVREGDRVDRIGLICAHFDGSNISYTSSMGGMGGISYDERCPAGFVLTGFVDIRTGSRVDRLRGICKAF